jgi:putative membrane protein
MMGWYGLGMGLWGGLMMLVFWGGLIVLVVWAIAHFSGIGRPATEDPTTVLRRRLASGEITQEQYEQARKALQS